MQGLQGTVIGTVESLEPDLLLVSRNVSFTCVSDLYQCSLHPGRWPVWGSPVHNRECGDDEQGMTTVGWLKNLMSISQQSPAEIYLLCLSWEVSECHNFDLMQDLIVQKETRSLSEPCLKSFGMKSCLGTCYILLATSTTKWLVLSWLLCFGSGWSTILIKHCRKRTKPGSLCKLRFCEISLTGKEQFCLLLQ